MIKNFFKFSTRKKEEGWFVYGHSKVIELFLKSWSQTLNNLTCIHDFKGQLGKFDPCYIKDWAWTHAISKKYFTLLCMRRCMGCNKHLLLFNLMDWMLSSWSTLVKKPTITCAFSSLEIDVCLCGPSCLDGCPNFKKPLWYGHEFTVIFFGWHCCIISTVAEFMTRHW